MAQKRMFSMRLVDSARFLQMPVSSRDLYFYLCMEADDDGIVEGYGVMRKLGAADDDWKVLVAKGFIRVLKSDEMVWYIVDWLEHNLIRPDRKVDSLYKELLLATVPAVRVIPMGKRADVKGVYKTKRVESLGVETKSGQSISEFGPSKLKSGPHRLGKVRLGKVSKAHMAVKTADTGVITVNQLIKNGELAHSDIAYKELISKLYYDAIKSLDVPVRNNDNVRSKIAEMARDKDRQKIVNYLEFMRDQFAGLDWDYKPVISEALDIFAKRAKVRESFARHIRESEKNEGVVIR